MVPLSVLDLATVAAGSTPADALADTTRLAPSSRSWATGGCGWPSTTACPSVASSAPAVLIGHLADATTTLRIGAGGVMLPNHAPLVIAEQFATLEALHPGRIDLGLGRAPGTDQVTARALRRTGGLGADTFPDDVVELINYLVDSDGPPTHPGPGARAGLPPRDVAARLVDLQRPAGRPARPALLLRLPLRPRPGGPGPRAVPVHVPALGPARPAPRHGGGVGALRPDDEEARWLAGPSALSILQLRTGRLGPLATPEEAAAYRYTPQERALIDATTVHPPDRRSRPGPPGPGRAPGADRRRRDHAVDPGPLLRGPGPVADPGGRALADGPAERSTRTGSTLGGLSTPVQTARRADARLRVTARRSGAAPPRR